MSAELVRNVGAVSTEVVETDLGCREVTQCRTGLLVQVAEHAVPDAVIGNGEQLLLDGLDQCCCRVPAGESVVEVDPVEGQSKWVDGGEPTDGAAEIGSRNHMVLSAVALERDQRVGHDDTAVSSPHGGRQSQSGQ